MYPRYAQLGKFTLLVLAAALTALPAAAQTITFNESISVAGGGTLDYQLIQVTRPCTYDNGKLKSSYEADTYGSFVYIPAGGGNVPIPGSYEVLQGGAQSGTCPRDTQWSGHINYLAKTSQVYIYPSSNGVTPSAAYVTGTFGYINPKYVVVSVFYAPPGSKSTAVYTNSNTVSSTTSLTNTFTSSITVTSSVSTLSGTPTPTGVIGWVNGTATSTSSTTLTQTSQNSSSVTAALTTTNGLTLPGPASDYVGLDHDYDQIEVWINPVLLFTVYDTTLSGETNIGWWGYGYSALDPTAPVDLWYIPVGCLNGDEPATASACAPPLKAFQRTWAASENWPTGQGPGLTATDLNNILAADPWGECKPGSAIGSSACPTYSTPGFLLPNFSLSDQSEIPYMQPQPGDQPATHPYGVSTTNSTTESSGTTETYSQTWGYELADKGTGFLTGFSDSLSESQTLTWSYSYNTSLTTSGTMTGTANITGPACVGSPCDPSYPPASQTFGTATTFNIFTDSRFGTFAFVPSSY
jgi:hypothetical protein